MKIMRMMIPGRKMMPLKNMMPVMLAKHEKMIRFEPNHNVYVITHHGKMMLGRKGRKG